MTASATYQQVEAPADLKGIRKQALGMLGSAPDQNAYNYGTSPDLRGSDTAALQARSNILRANDASAQRRAGADLSTGAEDFNMRVKALNENLRRRAAMQGFINQEGEKSQYLGLAGQGLSAIGQAVPGPWGAALQLGGAGASALGDYYDPEQRLREAGYV